MSRVLVVGWDGATWSVADRLTAQGRLPVLRSLRDGGAEGVLESVPNMNSAPAWSTIATGVGPGRHGIFYFDEPVAGTYRRTVINASRRAGRSLWRLVSDAGRRALVVNVPISYPAEPVQGALVSGLDCPSKSLPGFTYPRDLPDRYRDLFHDYVIEPGAPSLMRAGRVSEAIDKLYRSVDGWASVTERLLQDEDWDLAFVVFTSSDTAQHFFWTDEHMHVIERVYEIQDEATGRLLDVARAQDPALDTIVLADHGGAANSRGPEFMRIWLEERGLQARTRPSATSRAMAAGFGLVDRRLTRDQKQALARRFPRFRERAAAEARTAGIDWPRTRAYSDGVRDEVSVNVAGREPAGAVPTDAYGPFVESLKAEIGAIRELGTGRPVVHSVSPRDDIYQGPFVERAPDLTIRWEIGEAAFTGFETASASGDERMRRAVERPPFQPGGHHPEGILVANGPAVRPGPARGGLADVTPTVLSLLGIPVPDDLDGRVLPFADPPLQTAVASARPAGAAGAGAPTGEQEPTDPLTGYSAEEEEIVRKRLEDLGYL